MMFAIGFVAGFISYWIIRNITIQTDRSEYVESHRDKFYGR